jgi:hypothetical protein
MAGAKTRPTEEQVELYLQAISPPKKQADCRELAAMMSSATGEPPVMWGSSIVGFGTYHYRYDSGHEGDAPLTGFSSRTRNITIYTLTGHDSQETLLGKLGKYTRGKSCLYIKTLDDVDSTVLQELIETSIAHVKRTYPS